MSYRQVLIKNAYKMSLKDNNLIVHRKEENTEPYHIPLEDISIILVEDPFTVVTTRLISELSKHRIVMIFCDETFTPNTQTVPLNTHYSQLAVMNSQLKWTKEFKAEIWQRIVRQKIANQLRVIELTSGDQYSRNLLYDYIAEVKPYDSDNREGIASKVFFSSLYGSDFLRFSESAISNALNYGYSILSMALVRQLVSLGFNTNFGIWHDSDRNPFNLASDLIEPFRSLVDYFVYWHLDNLTIPLSFSMRKELVKLLTYNVKIQNKFCSVEYAMELVVKSLLKATNEKDPSMISLPVIIETDMFQDEYE